MIHENAIIHPTAIIGENVTIESGAYIGENVEIGDNCWIGPFAVVKGPTKMGQNNKIFQFASVGDAPQDTTYNGEPTKLEIGDNNTIREYCMISRGTVKGGELTKIGNNNYFMAYSHIGHDCHLGDNIIMINYAALAGHVVVSDYAIIGAYAGVHQFCQIGAHAFIARATYVTKDVLPYLMIAGANTEACGINSVGLKRRGFTSEMVDDVKRAYKIIFRQGLTVQEALAELDAMGSQTGAITPMIEGLKSATRGIVR